MRTYILCSVALLAVVASTAAASAASAAPNKAPLIITMKDPGCHWFYTGGGPNHRQYSKSVTRVGPVTLLNLDEAAMIVKGPGGTKIEKVGTKLMLETKGPRLIAGITDGDGYYYRGQFYYDFVKTNVIRMAFALAYELRKQKIAAVAITPGFLRSESMLDIMHVTEENWRDAAKKRPEWIESETPMLVGRAVAALAADRHVMKKTGRR